MNTADWQPGSLIQVLVIGPYKSGKTWGALTFPRPVVMDFDRGIATLRNPKFVAKYGLRNVEYEQFKDKFNSRGVPIAHDAFDAACRYFDLWMTPANVGKFDTWVIDSATTLSRASLHKGIMLLSDKGFAGAKSETYKSAVAHGLLVPKMQDYGAERSQLEQFVQMVLSSGKHVVLNCHERDEYREDGTLEAKVPLLTGQSKQVVPAMFDEVYFLRTRPKGLEMERVIQTEPDGLRRCGSRYGVPDGLPWEYDAIKKALDDIRAEQLKQAAEAKEVK